MLSAWIPTHERARAVSLTTSGMYLGSALAMEVLPTVRERLGVLSVQTHLLLWCLNLVGKRLSHARMRFGSVHSHELSVSLQVAALLGPAALLRMVGLAGLCWVALWRATMRQVARRRVELVCMHAHFIPYPPPPPPTPPLCLHWTTASFSQCYLSNSLTPPHLPRPYMRLSPQTHPTLLHAGPAVCRSTPLQGLAPPAAAAAAAAVPRQQAQCLQRPRDGRQ